MNEVEIKTKLFISDCLAESQDITQGARYSLPACKCMEGHFCQCRSHFYSSCDKHLATTRRQDKELVSALWMMLGTLIAIICQGCE